MKNITKKQSQEFTAKIESILMKNEFIYSADDSFSDSYGTMKVFHKDTQFGKLLISIPDQRGSEILTIYCKFENAEKALRIFNCNKFSGKYNFHYDKSTERVLISDFESFMTELNFDVVSIENE